MERNLPPHAGIGATVLIAAMTLAVAVVAGIFLIWQSGEPMNGAVPANAPAAEQARISLAAPAPGAQRRPDTASEAPGTGFSLQSSRRE